MFGYPREELMGKPVEVLIPERYRALHTSHRSRYAALPLRRPMGAGLQLSGRRCDGSEFPVEITLSPIVAEPGMHIACTIRDVTDRRRVESALRESERFTRSTFDALSEHICVLDETGTIIAVNKAWREFSAEGGSDLMGCTEGANYLATCDVATGTGAAEAKAFGDGIRAVMRGERDECLIEYPCLTPSGPRWYMGRATRFTGDGPIRVVVSFENVTELKRAELTIREAKNAAEAAKRKEAERRQEAERRRQIAESLRDALSILNSDRPLGDVLDYIALQANRLLGGQAAAVYRSGEDGEWVIIHTEHGPGPNPAATVWIPVDLDTLSQILMTQRAIVVPDIAAARADRDLTARGSEPPAFVVPVTDGYQAILAIPILLNDEVYGGLVLYDSVPRMFSLEEIELAVMFADQAALAIENARLKDEAKQAAVAAERNRLARDLHDAVTQVIFSASLIADALPRVWERNPEEGHKGLEELRQLTRGALAELRTLLFELRPAALLEKPLSDLLRQLTEATANRTRAPISLVVHGSCDVPAAVQVAIYRIAQEALSNVAKHADASQIGIHLGCSPHRLVLRVRDDGCGFVTSEVPAGHLGVEIMQERARSVGAVCRITSKPGKGTQVVVTWPAPAHTGSAAGRRASRRSAIPRGVHKSGQ
jgi:PAS domain S-box-containing protein